MFTLEDIAQSAQCLLLEQSAIRVKSGGIISPPKIKEALRILRSANVYMIDDDNERLEIYRERTEEKVRKLKRDSKRVRKESSKGNVLSIETTKRGEIEKNRAIKSLIRALERRQLNLGEYPPYQKFKDIVKYLNTALNIRGKYKLRNKESEMFERTIAAAYFFAAFIGHKTVILSDRLRYYLTFLEDSLSVLEQPDFEPENQRILERLRTTGIRYYHLDKKGNFSLSFDSATYNPGEGINLDLEHEIEVFRKKLQNLNPIFS